MVTNVVLSITALMLWVGVVKSVNLTIVKAIYIKPGYWLSPTQRYDVKPKLSALTRGSGNDITFTVNDDLITGPPIQTGRLVCSLWSGPSQLQVTIGCGGHTSTCHFTRGGPAMLRCSSSHPHTTAIELNPKRRSRGRNWLCTRPNSPVIAPLELEKELENEIYQKLLEWESIKKVLSEEELVKVLANQLTTELVKLLKIQNGEGIESIIDMNLVERWIDKNVGYQDRGSQWKDDIKNLIRRFMERKRLFSNGRALEPVTSYLKTDMKHTTHQD